MTSKFRNPCTPRRTQKTITRHGLPFFYGWVIVAMAFMNMCMTRGISSSFSVFFVAILKEYNWTRAEISGVYSAYVLLNFCSAFFIGMLIDRLGSRAVFPLGALLAGVGLAATSRSRELWHLYLWFGMVTSIGVCAFAWLPNSSAMKSWFSRKLGLAMGITNAGMGLGMLVFIPLSQALIQRFGWRNAILILACIVLGIIGPLNWLLQRNRPSDMNLLPDGDPPEQEAVSKARLMTYPKLETREPPEEFRVEWSIQTAVRTRAFWMLAIAFFCMPMVNFSLILHQMAYVVDKGFDPLYTAWALGFMGVVNSAGMILFGSISDRAGREITLTIAGVSMALSIAALGYLDLTREWALWAYVLLSGLGQGAGATLFPLMVADLFRGYGFGTIMGLLSINVGLGSALGAWILGIIYDRTGSYQPGFILLVLLMAVAIMAVWAAAPRHGPLKPGVRKSGRI